MPDPAAEPTAEPDPLQRFHAVFERALAAGIAEPTAMSLATVAADGRPSVRMVLLKEAGETGFVFYTNLGSRKARELAENPRAALCFYWQPIETQVRVEGRVEPVSEEEADVYFATRPRPSQISAWASRQSERLASREELEQRVFELEQRFASQAVPRPPFWSGFRLVPDRIEFWRCRPNRLHERDLYVRDAASEGGWARERLYP